MCLTWSVCCSIKGANTTDPANQIARHCGRTTNTQPILSSSAEMTVQFVSDGSVAYRGFSAQFKQGELCNHKNFHCYSTYSIIRISFEMGRNETGQKYNSVKPTIVISDDIKIIRGIYKVLN